MVFVLVYPPCRACSNLLQHLLLVRLFPCRQPLRNAIDLTPALFPPLVMRRSEKRTGCATSGAFGGTPQFGCPRVPQRIHRTWQHRKQLQAGQRNTWHAGLCCHNGVIVSALYFACATTLKHFEMPSCFEFEKQKLFLQFQMLFLHRFSSFSGRGHMREISQANGRQCGAGHWRVATKVT